jgi:hypothetical protein
MFPFILMTSMRDTLVVTFSSPQIPAKLGHILFGHIYFSATPPQRVTLNLALYTVNATHSTWIPEKLLLIMLFAILMLVFLEASDRPRRRTEFPDRRFKSA